MASRSYWITHPDNVALTASITAYSEEAIYPASNLKVLPITYTWRSTDASALQTIFIDLGSAKAIDIIGLVNINLSATAVVTIYGESSPLNSDYSHVGMTIAEVSHATYLLLPAAQTYRYWRVTISDPANTDGFVEVGYLTMGRVTYTTFMFRYGWRHIDDIHTSKVETEFGIPYHEELYEKRTLQLQYGPLFTTEIAVLRTLYKTVKRNTYPMLFIANDVDQAPLFGRIQNMFAEKIDFLRYVTIEFVEDSFGNRIEG